MLAKTMERVARHTSPDVNAEILAAADRRVAACTVEGPAAIARQLGALDAEWDIERTLEANAATAVLVGVTLGALVDRRFFALPAVVAGFLLQHALQGWCPPVPIFRRLGVRSEREIDDERTALKAVRGDFRDAGTPAAALAAARR